MSILILLGPAYISAQQKTEDSRLPPKRAHHSLAFDAKLGEMVLYGGSTAAENDTFTFFDDLWTWNGRQWNRLAVTGLPRSSHHLIYDAARKRLVLIGGMAGQQRYGETRVFDGKSWVAVHDNPALALSEPAVAYDSRRQRIVFFGGLRADRTLSGETWEFDGDNWKQVSTSGPGPLHSAAMVYDEARGVTLLFGGTGKQGRNGHTWQWDGSAWSQISTIGPPPRLAAGFAYDMKRKQAILFGGGGSNGILADTWLWDGKSWHEAKVQGPWLWDGKSWHEAKVQGPSGRLLPAMAYDQRRSVVVLFGGRIKYPEDSNETWEWDGKLWRQIK